MVNFVQQSTFLILFSKNAETWTRNNAKQVPRQSLLSLIHLILSSWLSLSSVSLFISYRLPPPWQRIRCRKILEIGQNKCPFDEGDLRKPHSWVGPGQFLALKPSPTQTQAQARVLKLRLKPGCLDPDRARPGRAHYASPFGPPHLSKLCAQYKYFTYLLRQTLAGPQINKRQQSPRSRRNRKPASMVRLHRNQKLKTLDIIFFRVPHIVEELDIYIYIFIYLPAFVADFQAQEWRAKQARPWTRQLHSLFQLWKVLPEGIASRSELSSLSLSLCWICKCLRSCRSVYLFVLISRLIALR